MGHCERVGTRLRASLRFLFLFLYGIRDESAGDGLNHFLLVIHIQIKISNRVVSIIGHNWRLIAQSELPKLSN